MPSLGNVVDVVVAVAVAVLVVVVVVVVRLGAARPDVVRVCPANGGAAVGSGRGSGSGSGSFGLDGGLLVLVGGFGLLEDVDYVLALLCTHITGEQIGPRAFQSWGGRGLELTVRSYIANNFARFVNDSDRLGELHLDDTQVYKYSSR